MDYGLCILNSNTTLDLQASIVEIDIAKFTGMASIPERYDAWMAHKASYSIVKVLDSTFVSEI